MTGGKTAENPNTQRNYELYEYSTLTATTVLYTVLYECSYSYLSPEVTPARYS